MRIEPLETCDRDWVDALITERWGANVVVHGTVYCPACLGGFIAWDGEERSGLVTYHFEGDACEVVTLDSLRPGIGIGTALIEAVCQKAQSALCRRLWLITTNDNLDALRFYQRRGFYLAAVHPGAVNEARRLKPEIPLVGDYGIPIRDEIELEMALS